MDWHPLAEKFPMLEGQEWEAFKASINKTKGPEQKIVFRTVNGKKQGLDGRNRFRACEQLGIKPPYEEVFFNDDESLDYIIRRNVHRRHLNPDVRQTFVVELRSNGQSLRTIAKTLKVSKSTVERDLAQVSHGGTPEVEKQGEKAQSSSPEPAKVTGDDGKKYPAKGKPKKLTKPTDSDADETPITDETGALVPEQSRGAFKWIEHFNKLSNHLNEAKRLINEIINGDAGHYLKGRNAHFETMVDNLKSQMKAGRPSHVCPYCSGTKPKCECCKGCGWVPRHVYKTSPVGDSQLGKGK